MAFRECCFGATGAEGGTERKEKRVPGEGALGFCNLMHQMPEGPVVMISRGIRMAYVCQVLQAEKTNSIGITGNFHQQKLHSIPPRDSAVRAPHHSLCIP